LFCFGERLFFCAKHHTGDEIFENVFTRDIWKRDIPGFHTDKPPMDGKKMWCVAVWLLKTRLEPWLNLRKEAIAIVVILLHDDLGKLELTCGQWSHSEVFLKTAGEVSMFTKCFFAVKLEQYDLAVEAFERSLEMAKLQGDTAAEVAISNALKDVKSK